MTRLASLGSVIRFLTLIPVPRSHTDEGHHITGSLYLFPVVGLLIGLLSAGAGGAALYLFGSPVHAVVVVLTTSIITAGFHLDGLADTCDALFSWRDRDRKLEIMKDSRIGAMGAIALILVIALKIAALLALDDAWWIGAVLCPAFGRWADLYGIACFPAARSEGLATEVGAGATGQFSRASLILCPVAAGLFFWGGWWLVAAALAAAFVVVHWVAAAASRSLGGLTGDVYGALSEIGEVCLLLALCTIASQGAAAA